MLLSKDIDTLLVEYGPSLISVGLVASQMDSI